MHRPRTTRSLVVAALSILFESTARAQPTASVAVAEFAARPQEQSHWCWAASIQALFLTKGIEVEQSAIVTAAYGRLVNATAPGFEGTLRLLNAIVVDVQGNLWRVRANAGPTYPEALWLVRRFQASVPVMIRFRDPSANHSIVLNGGTYYTSAASAFLGWQTPSAYDPFFGRDMTIDATNIPRYVYGTFEVSIRSAR